jgi:hypothetical protein
MLRFVPAAPHAAWYPLKLIVILQNFMTWLDLFDNIVTNWKKLIAVHVPSRAATRGDHLLFF